MTVACRLYCRATGGGHRAAALGSDEQLGLANTIIDMWVDFGRKPDSAEWPVYRAETRNVVALQLAEAGGITTITEAFQAHNCGYWNQ